MCRSPISPGVERPAFGAVAPDFLAIAKENEAKRHIERPAPKRLLLENVRIFDGNRIMEPSSIAIDDGRIVERVSDAEKYDCKGHILIPGLVDAHVHPLHYVDLKTMAQIGVTTAMSMGTFNKEHMASLRNHVGVTDMLVAGLPAAGPDNRSVKFLANWPTEETLTEPSQAEGFVDLQLSRGAEYVKIIADIPGMSQEIINALVDASRRRKKLVVCHAAAAEPARQSLRAGADQLHHSPTDALLSEADVEHYKRLGSINCPTLTAMEIFSKAMPRPGSDYSKARDNVRALHKAGVTILAGTDANETPQFPVSIPFVTSFHRELELLSEAGLSNLDVLRSATVLPAKHFGLNDRGVIALGYRADLVLLSANPLEDITATTKIEEVWIEGVEVS